MDSHALTRTRDSRNAQYLARLQLKRHIGKRGQTIFVLDAQLGHFQQALAMLARRALYLQLYTAADHQFGQLLNIRVLGNHAAHAFALAQYDHAVGYFKNFVQLMRDYDYRA